MLTTRYILCCPTPQCCSFRILHVKSLGHLHSKCYCKHKNISQIEDSNSLCSFTLLLTLFRLLQLQLVCLASCSLYPSYLTHRLGSCCRHPNRTQLILRPHSWGVETGDPHFLPEYFQITSWARHWGRGRAFVSRTQDTTPWWSLAFPGMRLVQLIVFLLLSQLFVSFFLKMTLSQFAYVCFDCSPLYRPLLALPAEVPLLPCPVFMSFRLFITVPHMIVCT